MSTYDALGRKGCVDFNSLGLARAIVHHFKCSELSNTHQAVSHKVHAPALIDRYGVWILDWKDGDFEILGEPG
jgi:hypothetical protein